MTLSYTIPDWAAEPDDYSGLAAWVDDDGTFGCAPEYEPLDLSPYPIVAGPMTAGPAAPDLCTLVQRWRDRDAVDPRLLDFSNPDASGPDVLGAICLASAGSLFAWIIIGVLTAWAEGRL